MRQIIGATWFACCIVAAADAQAPPQNLKVLPKDMTRPQVVALMRTFTVGLGVQCSYCHAGVAPELVHASDEKPTKETARKMLRMMLAINEEHLKEVGEPPVPGTRKVTCYTCHRGTTKPLTAPAIGGG